LATRPTTSRITAPKVPSALACRSTRRWLQIDQELDERDAGLSELDEEWYSVDEELQRRLREFAQMDLGD
jgi:hypothetical protein